MAWTRAKDISQWQGNWQDTGEPIVMIKCGGGDAGLYFDSKCTEDYNGAVAAGRAVGLYWFIGWTLGAEQEAAFFLKGVSPLAENDVYALDIEKGSVPVPANAVAYVTDMVNFIHDRTGVWPLLYMNLSTLNQFDWSSLLKNCGLWLADWAVSPDANIPTSHMYVMQQYSDGPVYDHDAFFGTVDQFKAYGYHAPNVQPITPPPAPTPPPVVPSPPPAVSPVPSPPPPAPEPQTTTVTPSSTTTHTVSFGSPAPEPKVGWGTVSLPPIAKKKSLWQTLISFLLKLKFWKKQK